MNPFGKKLDLFHPHWNSKFFCMFSCLVGDLITDSTMECITIEPSIILRTTYFFQPYQSRTTTCVVFCEEAVVGEILTHTEVTQVVGCTKANFKKIIQGPPSTRDAPFPYYSHENPLKYAKLVGRVSDYWVTRIVCSQVPFRFLEKRLPNLTCGYLSNGFGTTNSCNSLCHTTHVMS